MTRIFLLLQALSFGGFGLSIFFQPHILIEMLGAPSMSSDGIYEIRGVYGGVSIGAAFLYLAGFLKTHMERPALYFVLAYTGGYALARIAALPLDGIPGPKLIFFAGFEIISAFIAIYLLRRSST